MKITEKQLQMLILTLKDTLIFYEGEMSYFSFNIETRQNLLHDIVRQQSQSIVDIETLNEAD